MRSLSRALFKCGTLPVNWRDYLMTIGIGEGCCSPEMPIIAALAAKYREFGGEFKWYFNEYRLATNRCSDDFLMPSDESRAWFALSFDIDVPTQRIMESEIAAMVLTFNDQH